MVSDLRLSGGTTASIAEEIRAQAASGYRTALLHTNSPLTGKARGVSAHLRGVIDDGLADLVMPGDVAHARHAVVRHPVVAQHLSEGRFPGITADGVMLVANHPVRDGAGVEQYNPVAATESIEQCFGHRPTWRPIGPVVRAQLEPYPEIDLAATDWVNIIDAPRWAVSRRDVRPVPVIGRHSRAHATKWPDRAQDILAAYPDSDDVQVRILGGAEPARKVLGSIPEAWLVEPFGARSVMSFVATIDFFVYYHHPAWVEAFGRNIMEALAAGAVAILPEHFRATFGDAALYARPDEVRDVVRSLDRPAYLEQSARGTEFIRARHDYPVHVRRLIELGGPPANVGEKPVSVSRRPAPSVRGPESCARVLFVSSNGTGMGHLTRLLAMATRSSDRIEPFFFSMSSAVPVVAQFGYSWEYCPSREDLGVRSSKWNLFFESRFTEILRRYDPQALVFDGTWPYRGLENARKQFPDVLYAWSRRGMWHHGHRTDGLEKSAWFDLVIEPGEFAAPADRGPTVGRTDAVRVGPVCLLDPPQILDRAAARAELGMSADEQAILVTLGGGNVNDVGPDLNVISRAVARRPGWTVYATRAPITRIAAYHQADIRTISCYPLCRVLKAFDAAVVACGYNSYHESILAAIPTIFVPQPRVTDDQPARARYARETGVAVAVDHISEHTIDAALDQVFDPAQAERMRARCIELRPANGAADAMELVEKLLLREGVIA
jgi:UDP:flavonoid glycosyltransferase YjiC (YdhE family)